MTAAYLGIDFANREANHGRCWLLDDGQQLVASFSKPEADPSCTGVDCPFGTTAGFESLLRGEKPAGDPAKDGFKSRATELLMRSHVRSFATNTAWKALAADQRDDGSSRDFFNAGSHVQSTLGMVIVPACINWLTDELASEGSAAVRLAAVRRARLGCAPIIEAHPRLYLYSALERIWGGGAAHFNVAVLGTIAAYKRKGAPGEEGRKQALELLRTWPDWQPTTARRRVVTESEELLLASDHAFDAWLCALTAWSHAHGDTWTWSHAGLPEDLVEVEGHILILQTGQNP